MPCNLIPSQEPALGQVNSGAVRGAVPRRAVLGRSWICSVANAAAQVPSVPTSMNSVLVFAGKTGCDSKWGPMLWRSSSSTCKQWLALTGARAEEQLRGCSALLQRPQHHGCASPEVLPRTAALALAHWNLHWIGLRGA